MSENTQGPLSTPGVDTEPSWYAQWRRIVSIGWTEIREIIFTIVNNWFRHNVPRLGASLAFYTLLSLAPLLIIVIAIPGAVFGREAAEGQSLGFDGKSLIHPKQIAACNRAFSPSEEEIDAARRLVAAYGGGAERFEGGMIERMHVAAAERLLERARL